MFWWLGHGRVILKSTIQPTTLLFVHVLRTQGQNSFDWIMSEQNVNQKYQVSFFPRHRCTFDSSPEFLCSPVYILKCCSWRLSDKLKLPSPALQPVFLCLFFKRSMLERSEQQVRAAAGLEELLRITHFEDWKLWRCRLKLKSFPSTDMRSASHRSTRFAATFYDLETLKGKRACVEAHPCSFSDPNKCTSLLQKFGQGGMCQGEEQGALISELWC